MMKWKTAGLRWSVSLTSLVCVRGWSGAAAAGTESGAQSPPCPQRLASIRGYPPRLLGYAIAVVALGLRSWPWPRRTSVSPRLGRRADIGLVVFLACALGSELRPVSLDIAGQRVVSLAFIFIVSAQILFGWEVGVAVGALAMFGSQLADWRGPLKAAFNCSVYAIAAVASASLHAGNLVGRSKARARGTTRP